MLNAGLFVLFGIWLWCWILFFTDWIPLFEGLLGLGGIVAWGTFIFALLGEDTKKEVRAVVSSYVLEWPGARFWILVASVGLIISSQLGSIWFNSVGDSVNRSVLIWDAQEGKTLVSLSSSVLLVAGGSRRRLFWSGFSGRYVYIRPRGLPGRRVKVRAMTATEVYLPDYFGRQPVVLIRPRPRMSANADNTRSMHLVVCKGASLLGKISSREYRGQTVWVGCPRDVAIPSEVLSRWRLELKEKELGEEILVRWLDPLAVAQDMALRAGDKIGAKLVNSDGSVYAVGSITVAPLTSAASVQELRLDDYEPNSKGTEKEDVCAPLP